MFSFHEPTWAKVTVSVTVGTLGMIGLFILRAKARRDKRRMKLHYDPDKYISDLVERQFMEGMGLQPKLKRPDTRTWRPYTILGPVLWTLATLSAFGGLGYALLQYKILSNLDEGDQLMKQEDYVGAIVAYRKALSADDKVVVSHYDLGRALVSAQRTSEALTEYRHAVELNPMFAEAHLNYATALESEGQYEKACDEYQRVITLTPNNVLGYLNLGNTYAKMLRYEDAFKEYLFVLNMDPQNL